MLAISPSGVVKRAMDALEQETIWLSVLAV